MAGYPFVGREDVLADLKDALARAAAGRGGLVSLTGAAGAGKTRTAEEAVARADGFRTLWTCCPPGTTGRALWPWSRLLRELVSDDVRCGRLVSVSPPLRALVSGAGAGSGGRTDPEAARLRLTGDVAEVLATAAQDRPLLLVLDDVAGSCSGTPITTRSFTPATPSTARPATFPCSSPEPRSSSSPPPTS
ncbi:AAA family ATPase [Streptomyces violascens]|uniref:AAA family ATPase n=1 Tax=Streptomyces violascens TaxID=67381 RepID=UPI003661C72A